VLVTGDKWKKYNNEIYGISVIMAFINQKIPPTKAIDVIALPRSRSHLSHLPYGDHNDENNSSDENNSEDDDETDIMSFGSISKYGLTSAKTVVLSKSVDTVMNGSCFVRRSQHMSVVTITPKTSRRSISYSAGALPNEQFDFCDNELFSCET
jgi:hypothetical protein